MKGSACRYALTVFILLLFSANQLLIAQPVQVGDLITFADGSKGIVCYVDPANDQKGWVADLNDMDTTYQLYTASSVVNNPPMTNRSPLSLALSSWTPEGKANTLALFQMQSGANYSPAARAVDPESGWYIPDADQIMIMASLVKQLQPAFEQAGGNITKLLTLNRNYWTSTRYNLNHFYLFTNNSTTTGARLTTNNNNLTRPHLRHWIRRVRDFDFGSEPSVYWAIQPKEDSIRVSPEVTTAYDALVIYGTDTLTVQSSVIVHPTFNKDTIYGDTIYAYEDFDYSLHNVTFHVTEDGDYKLYDTLQTIYGCDSIQTVILHVRAPKEVTYYDTVCQSQVNSYTDGPNDPLAHALFGQSSLDSLVRVSGALIKENVYMKDEYGNDSIVNFYLIVKTKRHDTTVTVTNFTGDTYFWHDSLYTVTGNHSIYTQLTDGCDFYDFLHLIILDIDTSANAICQGESSDLIITVTKRKDPNDTSPKVPRVGDVLCTDGTVMHPDSFLTSGKTAMGVVLTANPKDGFGRAIALNESSLQWYKKTQQSVLLQTLSNTNASSRETALQDMDGDGNTANIMATLTSISDVYANAVIEAYAVTYCYYYDHTTESMGTESHGWYLPSAGEAFMLRANQKQLNNSLTKLGKTNMISAGYWTSTQYSSTWNNYLWFWYVSTYDLYEEYSYYTQKVRPLIHFSLP